MPQTAASPIVICSSTCILWEQLIAIGVVMAKEQKRPLILLSIQPKELVSPHVAQNIQSLYNMATTIGAEITVLFSEERTRSLADYAKQIRAAHIILHTCDTAVNDMFGTLRQLLPEIPLTVLQTDGQLLTFSSAAAHHSANPPSTPITCPVIKEASSDSKNATAAATS